MRITREAIADVIRGDFRAAVDPLVGGTKRRRAPGRVDRSESGFTLIELLIVAVVLPVLIGGITYALVAVLTIQGSVGNRISDSADAQLVSANFEKDVQSAAMLTTDENLPVACGTTGETQLLGLEWSPNQPTNPTSYESVVSYVEVPNNSSNSQDLVRNYCASGQSTTPTTSSVISSDIPLTQAAPTVTTSGGLNPASGWISTASVTGVVLGVTEPASNFNYQLSALPAGSSSTNQASTVVSSTTSCGFAEPGTGTYASTLCFVDFSPWNVTPQTSAPGVSCPASTAGAGAIGFSEAVADTPFTMTFCLSTTGGTVAAVQFPTYTDLTEDHSEAFLGNNGFYTGVPGDPALYQTQNATTTVAKITSIQVLDSNGNPATGWQLVTGDAESTDAGESITWAATWSSNSTVPGSEQVLTLLPNSPTSEIGDACAEPMSSNPYNIYLQTLGTNKVECESSIQLPKDGTVMLKAPAPSNLTVTLVGAGLQAFFLGLLLP